eukprot:551619-Rhodomonas_salina.1
MSATMPGVRIWQPADGSEIGVEDNVLLLGLEHVNVQGPKRPLSIGGHWHAYATPANNEVEICYRVVPEEEVGSAEKWGGARMEEEEEVTGQHAFGTR